MKNDESQKGKGVINDIKERCSGWFKEFIRRVEEWIGRLVVRISRVGRI